MELIREIVRFVDYADAGGYQISQDAVTGLLCFLGDSDVACTDLMDMEPYMRVFFVKNASQNRDFHDFLETYVKERKVLSDKESRLRKQKEEQNARARKLQKQMNGTVFPESLIKSMKKYEEDYQKALSVLKPRVRGWLEKGEYRKLDAGELEKVREAAETAMWEAAFGEHGKEVMAILKKQIRLIEKQKGVPQSFKVLERERTVTQKELEMVLKQLSSSHRPQFTTGKRSVRSYGTGEITDKRFAEMTEKEKEDLRHYIRANAVKFRTRMTKRIRTGDCHRIDMAQTMKGACATNGIPLKLHYVKPKRNKARLVLMLDVSGSCSKASELMLNFMYYMRDVFPGGCSLYAFTNTLYDISAIMDADDADEAVRQVLKSIPRAGAYSNYERPFAELCPHITSDSLVFVIGDARNNKNPSGEEYVKSVGRKAKKLYWMNTDSVEKWNQGDSIIGTYMPYLDKCGQVLSPAELIGFLMNI